MNVPATLIAAIASAIAGLSISHVFFPLSTQVIDKSRGQELFADHCAGCHNLQQDAAPMRGPSLHGIAEWGETRIEGMSAEEYVYESIVDPGGFQAPGAQGMMPASIADELRYGDLLDITAFLTVSESRADYAALLRNRKREPAQTERTRLPTVQLSAIERGEHLYRNMCMQCHDLEIGQHYDPYYPNLRNAGQHSEAYLREAIVEPSKTFTPGYESWMIRTTEESLMGRLLHEDPQRVVLIVLGHGGFAVREFSKAALVPFDDGEVLSRSPVSEMPPLGLALSEDDLDSLLTFLTFLRT